MGKETYEQPNISEGLSSTQFDAAVEIEDFRKTLERRDRINAEWENMAPPVLLRDRYWYRYTNFYKFIDNHVQRLLRVSRVAQKMDALPQPHVMVVRGQNQSGKSRFTREYLHNLKFIFETENPRLVANLKKKNIRYVNLVTYDQAKTLALKQGLIKVDERKMTVAEDMHKVNEVFIELVNQSLSQSLLTLVDTPDGIPDPTANISRDQGWQTMKNLSQRAKSGKEGFHLTSVGFVAGVIQGLVVGPLRDFVPNGDLLLIEGILTAIGIDYWDIPYSQDDRDAFGQGSASEVRNLIEAEMEKRLRSFKNNSSKLNRYWSQFKTALKPLVEQSRADIHLKFVAEETDRSRKILESIKGKIPLELYVTAVLDFQRRILLAHTQWPLFEELVNIVLFAHESYVVSDNPEPSEAIEPETDAPKPMVQNRITAGETNIREKIAAYQEK